MTTEGKEIKLQARVPGTQFDIDSKFRVKMNDGGALRKVFGSGIAFPTRTTDGRIIPEAGKPNPRADSFSLYLNYVGTKILENILPKSKLLSKAHFIYNEKILKKRKQENLQTRAKTGQANTQSKQLSEQKPINNNTKYAIKNDKIIEDKKPVSKRIIIEKPKTPAKKSYPQKMREKVNSCKKTESKKIISINSGNQMGNKIQNYNKSKSKEKLHLKERGINGSAKIPSSYYASEAVSKSVVSVQNKAHISRSQIKDPIKPVPSALDVLVSPQKTNNVSNIVKQNLSKLNNTKVLKQTTNSQQMGGSKPVTRRLPSQKRVVAMESGGFANVHLRNVGAGIITTKATSNLTESKEIDTHHIPVKIFEMDGEVRPALKSDEMQGTTIYKTESNNPKLMNATIRRTSSKKRRSNLKMPNNLPESNTHNPMSKPFDENCSPIISTHPYRLGFLY